MKTITIILGVLPFVICSCKQEQKERLVKTEKGYREFSKNGFIKTEFIKESDSLEDKYFYSPYDSGKLDSLHQFKLFYDTLLPWRQYIYNSKQIARELAFETVSLDSGNFVKFKLLNPRYDIISIYLRKDLTDMSKDTVIWGVLRTVEPRQFYLRDPGDSMLSGFVVDWGWWAKTYTDGSIGLQMNRYLKYEIRKRNYIPQRKT